MLKTIDLFAGAGGLVLALSKLGILSWLLLRKLKSMPGKHIATTYQIQGKNLCSSKMWLDMISER